MLNKKGLLMISVSAFLLTTVAYSTPNTTSPPDPPYLELTVSDPVYGWTHTYTRLVTVNERMSNRLCNLWMSKTSDNLKFTLVLPPGQNRTYQLTLKSSAGVTFSATTFNLNPQTTFIFIWAKLPKGAKPSTPCPTAVSLAVGITRTN